MNILRTKLGTVGLILLGLWLGGCATQRVDWSARVGNYTFDQAISEIGPPDKQAKLTDGTIVAEWMTQQGYQQIAPIGGYHYHGPYRYYYPAPPVYVSGYAPSYYLRLTFAPDGKLTAWKNFSR